MRVISIIRLDLARSFMPGADATAPGRASASGRGVLRVVQLLQRALICERHDGISKSCTLARPVGCDGASERLNIAYPALNRRRRHRSAPDNRRR